MTTYTVGQTANLSVGPITDVITADVYDPTPLTLTVTEPGSTTPTVYTEGVDAEIVRVSEGNYYANVPLTATGMWRAVWSWGTGSEIGEATHNLWAQDPVTFATAAQVAARLGRDLTTAELTHVPALLQLATDVIVEACGKTDAWPATVDPIPPALRVVCIEATVRILHNPTGARSTQEQLGSYLHSESYSGSGESGLYLTAIEERKVRRAVHGAATASVRVGSLIDEAVIVDRFDQGEDDLFYYGS